VHRFLWDLHYAPVPGVAPQYPIAAVAHNTAPEATSPWAMPGNYTVVLTANGKSYSQPLTIRMDPRVKTSTPDLSEQFRLSKQLYDQWLALASIGESVRIIRGRLTELRPRMPDGDLKSHLDALSEKLQQFAGGGGPGGFGGGGGGAGARLTVASASGRIRALFNAIEEVDLAPNPQTAAATGDVMKDARTLQENWEGLKTKDIPALNQELRAAGLPAMDLPK